MTHTWSDDDRKTVADHLRQGLSAGQIARALPFDTTRNAIIGIVMRNGCLKQIGFARAVGFSKPKKRKKPDPPQEKKPPRHKPENRFLAEAKGNLSFGKPKVAPPPDLPPPPLPLPVGIRLVEIREGQCRWPLWADYGGPDFAMCGAKTAIDQHYCEGHRARAARAM